MSWKGDCWNNVEIESFLSSRKTERSSRWNYATRDQVRADVFNYIERSYNPRRRHSTLGYVCPDQFEQARMSLRYCPRRRAKPRTGVRHDRALGSCGSAVHARRANLSNPSGSNRSDVLAELSSDTPHGTVSAVRRTRQPFERAGVGRQQLVVLVALSAGSADSGSDNAAGPPICPRPAVRARQDCGTEDCACNKADDSENRRQRGGRRR